MVIRRQKAAQAQKAHAANDNLPTTTPPPPAAPTARLVKGECIVSMDAMVAGLVDLIVTSPPYLNIGMPYGDSFASIEDYIEFSRQWITAAARVLKPSPTARRPWKPAPCRHGSRTRRTDPAATTPPSALPGSHDERPPDAAFAPKLPARPASR
ncbi:DNA methyltransferase [Brevundimonas sp. KM4]|uniref:DNA methyltransferase n=1 Tax=Brevundimonas sp. KM4 TaxID=1628191 RepID=UPI0005F82450|nr:DNA methyltransferase [Brevundimonas sp. KM4]